MLPAPADHRCRSRILLTCVCEPCCWSSSSSWSRQSRSPAMATARMPWGLTERPGSGRCTYTRRDQRSPALELQAYAALRRRRRQGPADTHCQPSYAALSFDRSIDQVRNKSLVNGSLQREVSWTARLSLRSHPSSYHLRYGISRLRTACVLTATGAVWSRPAWVVTASSRAFGRESTRDCLVFECSISRVRFWVLEVICCYLAQTAFGFV